eukprot:6254529-Pyramimonas_sp.AAC.1
MISRLVASVWALVVPSMLVALFSEVATISRRTLCGALDKGVVDDGGPLGDWRAPLEDRDVVDPPCCWWWRV